MAEHRQPDADGVSVGAYAEAYRHLCKAAGEAEVSYAMRGRLYLSRSGWLLLSVPNALARGVFDTIHEPGVELPTDGEGRLNAHVSVMTPSEVEQAGGAGRISERGHMVAWTLGPLRTCVPDGWKGVSRVWFCEARSPELEKIRKSYGLSPTPKYPFHLTVAVRKTSVLRHNDVKKADAPDRLPGGEADGEPDSAFPPEALAEGARHEREHTTDPVLAREIAKDHLRGEGADYYEKLEAMEGGGEKAATLGAALGEPSSEIRGGSVDGERALADLRELLGRLREDASARGYHFFAVANDPRHPGVGAEVSGVKDHPDSVIRRHIALHRDWAAENGLGDVTWGAAKRAGAADGKRAAVTYVPRAVLDAVRAEGLLSGERVAERPELLERLAVARKAADPAAFAADFKRTVADKVRDGRDSPRGPNVLFKPPPASTALPDNHPLRQWDLVPVRVKLERLLRDVPGTRVHGQELTPYSKAEDEKDPEYHKRRHHDLDAGELRRLARASAARLWATYADPDGKGMYAPNVPHAAVVTPDGRIDPKYLTFPKDAAAGHLAEYLGDPDPEEFDMAAVKQAAAGYRFEGDVQGVGLRKHLHDQLDRHGLPGVAYNDARTGDALAVLGGPEAKRRAAVKDLTDRLDAIGADYRVTPTEVRQRLRRVLVDAAAADRFVDRQGFSTLKERGTPAALQWLADRYRLRPNAEGVLEGRLPPPAVRQIRGLDPVYAYQLDADEWAKRYGGQNRPYWAGRKPWRDAPAAVKTAALLTRRKRRPEEDEDLRRPGVLPWLSLGAGGAEKAAALAGRKKRVPDEDLRHPGMLPWLALGTGTAAMGAGGALATDTHVNESLAALARMSQPWPPNRTLFTQYADSLSPAAASTPFGLAIGDVLPRLRTNRWLMGVEPASVMLRGDPGKAEAWLKMMKDTKYPFNPDDNPYTGASLFGVHYGKYVADLADRKALRGGLAKKHLPTSFVDGRIGGWIADALDYAGGRVADVLDYTGLGDILDKGAKQPSYHLSTPWAVHGHRAGHYRAFSGGPIPAYSHMVRSFWGHAPVKDTELTGGRPMTYNTYFTPKFEQFIRERTQGNMVPDEFDIKTMPAAEQTKLLDEWIGTLTPKERAEMDRTEATLRTHLKDENIPGYTPLIRSVARLKQLLHAAGVTVGAAGLGGLAAHRLYRWLYPDDPREAKNQQDWRGVVAATAGMGMGGAAGYLAGTEDGRRRVADAVEALRAKLFPTLLKKEGWVGAAAKVALPALKWLGAGAGLGAGAIGGMNLAHAYAPSEFRAAPLIGGLVGGLGANLLGQAVMPDGED